MSEAYVVIENKNDWEPYYPSSKVLTFEEYVSLPAGAGTHVFVINLCRNYKYLSKGYYTSLLAEARGHKVIPNVKAINDLSRKSIYGLHTEDFSLAVNRALGKNGDGATTELSLVLYFGTCPHKELDDLAWKLFESYPFPILRVKFEKASTWHIESIRPGSIHSLEGAAEDAFAAALDQFDKKIWRKPREKKRYRYDLAILHDPEEKLPPSNAKALKKMITAAKDFSIKAELIEKKELPHLAEYDGLFIRATTAINHFTYTFARKAESNGLVVIDSPSSILRCANKVYLHEQLLSLGLKMPATILLDPHKMEALGDLEQLTYPKVLKIPDGSFSAGVFLAKDARELREKCHELFQKSVLILAQEFLYTDFDWRVGVLNRKPLFVCRYFMTKGHWQIYHYQEGKRVTSGGFEALPVHQAPKRVISAAVKAANAIGDGLYGVDLKEINGEVYVIEVNDNPNLDAGVEDAYLGEDLYLRLMEDFHRRLDH